MLRGCAPEGVGLHSTPQVGVRSCHELIRIFVLILTFCGEIGLWIVPQATAQGRNLPDGIGSTLAGVRCISPASPQIAASRSGQVGRVCAIIVRVVLQPQLDPPTHRVPTGTDERYGEGSNSLARQCAKEAVVRRCAGDGLLFVCRKGVKQRSFDASTIWIRFTSKFGCTDRWPATLANRARAAMPSCTWTCPPAPRCRICSTTGASA